MLDAARAALDNAHDVGRVPVPERHAVDDAYRAVRGVHGLEHQRVGR